MSKLIWITAFALVTGIASAGEAIQGAPEIDPSSAMTGLTLLLGGLAVLRGRSRK